MNVNEWKIIAQNPAISGSVRSVAHVAAGPAAGDYPTRNPALNTSREP